MKLGVAFLLVALLWSCAALTPPPDRTPCGARGHSCGNHACCDIGYSCIAGGLCEFTEDNTVSAKPPRRQTPAK